MIPDGLTVHGCSKGCCASTRVEMWNDIYQQALDALTDEWQPWYCLAQRTGLSYSVFDGLYQFGDADMGSVPIVDYNGFVRGHETYFKRADACMTAKETVLSVIRRGGDWTIQEVCSVLGWSSNRVSIRMTELKQASQVEESTPRRCKITGIGVTPLRLRTPNSEHECFTLFLEP